jgi:hypothetical protein
MKYLETRTVAEYQLDNSLIACIRELSLPDTIRVDLSIYQKMVDVPELHLYSNLRQGKNNIDGMIDILAILSDEDKCLKTWKNYVELNQKKED